MSTTNPTDVITEWEELQIKYGNFAPRPPAVTNEELSKAAIEFAEQQDVLEGKSLKELEQLEDDVEEETLELYRRRRLEELKKQKEAYKFGEVVHVNRSEYVTEVTEASKGGQVVILHLYAESKPVCVLLNRAFVTLARRHGSVKFCKAIGTDVIESLPDARVPTVLVYKDGVCAQQFLGGTIWGGEQLTPACVEWVLWKRGFLPNVTDEDDPRPKGSAPVRRPKDIRDDGSSSSTSDDEFERNADRRGYSSIALERALRLK